MDKVHVIRIDNGGKVEPEAIVVKPGDVVVWVPTRANVKVKIKFTQNKPPFTDKEFPDRPMPGEAVARLVQDVDAIDYSYKASGTGQRSGPIIDDGDPIIIVRRNDNRRVKSKTAKKKK